MIEARDDADALPHDAATAGANATPNAGGGHSQSSEVAVERGAGEPTSDNLEERIREKARELWMLEGRPNEDGHEQRHWDMARQLILQDQRIHTDAHVEPPAPTDIGKHP